MARKAIEVKCERIAKIANKLHTAWKKIPFATKLYHRCSVCWRVRGYMWKFDMCRICVREKANAWELMWVRKSSW